MRIARLLLGLCLAVSICAGAEPEPQKPFVEPQTGVTFPTALGPFLLVTVHTYEQRQLGVCIRYETPKPAFVRADIFIYDMGKKDLGTGIKSEAVKEAFEAAKRDVQTMVERGRYEDLKRLGEKTISLRVGDKPLPMHSAAFEYTLTSAAGDVDMLGRHVSHLFLTGYKDQFLKVRLTYPKAVKTDGDGLLKEFLILLGKTLQ